MSPCGCDAESGGVRNSEILYSVIYIGYWSAYISVNASWSSAEAPCLDSVALLAQICSRYCELLNCLSLNVLPSDQLLARPHDDNSMIFLCVSFVFYRPLSCISMSLRVVSLHFVLFCFALLFIYFPCHFTSF